MGQKLLTWIRMITLCYIFQEGLCCNYLWYQNRSILPILNLHLATLPPIKFQLNPTYRLGTDVAWRVSRWPPAWPSWISEQKTFSNSESPCQSNASHQFLAQSDIAFGRICHILAILKLHVALMPSTKFWLNLTYYMGADVVWRVSRWPPWWPSCISEGPILAILNLHVSPMPPTKFRLNPTLGSEADVAWRFLRHLGYPNWMTVAILNLMPSTKFRLNPTYRPGADFQDGHCGGHVRYSNKMIFAILNRHVTPMPPAKFKLNLTYYSGADGFEDFQSGCRNLLPNCTWWEASERHRNSEKILFTSLDSIYE